MLALCLGVFVALGIGACDSLVEPGEPVEVLPPEPRTPPLSYEGFDPGNIISDEEFFDSSAMTEEQVEAFVNTWNDGCRTGIDGTPCLSEYREDTPSYTPDEYCPGGFEGGVGDTAASIIWKTSQSCGINPQVLLVTLQKEQGLITASGLRLNETRYAIAMGYACPDSSHCDPEFYGFANQVYHGARQMRIYQAHPENYSVVPWQTTEIKYAYPPECGSSPVYLENQATANLYNYTPYQPNDNAMVGIRGECESAGNLNFYAYFNAWFGNAS